VGMSFGGAGAGASGSVVDAAAEFLPGAFTSVLELVRGKIRRDSGHGAAGGVTGRAGS
jgi:hypothetical protein